jgi:hypothetical protein
MQAGSYLSLKRFKSIFKGQNMKKFALLSILFLACCSSKPQWGTVTDVDKDNRIIFSSLWHYTVEMDDGTIRTGRTKVIIKKGWRIRYEKGYITRIEKK